MTNQKKEFIRAVAEFCAGNQVAKGISLQMQPGIAGFEKDWIAVRNSIPALRGYPTVAEAEEIINKFLYGRCAEDEPSA